MGIVSVSCLIDTLPFATPLQDGSWDDVSGETFLRRLLAMPIQEAKWNVVSGRFHAP